MTCNAWKHNPHAWPYPTNQSWCWHIPFNQWQHSFQMKAVLPLAKRLMMTSQCFKQDNTLGLNNKQDSIGDRGLPLVIPSHRKDGSKLGLLYDIMFCTERPHSTTSQAIYQNHLREGISQSSIKMHSDLRNSPENGTVTQQDCSKSF